MTEILTRELPALAAAFITGSLPTAWLWVKWRRGKDIRALGSGNAGATNVFRAVGKRDGLLVLFVDAFKGWLAASLFGAWGASGGMDTDTFRLLAGLAAVAGHVFTPFLGFRGGKGVATAAGVGLAVYPIPFALALAVWGVVLGATRYMSVASLASGYVFALTALLAFDNPWHRLLAVGAALFITWTHRANLKRLRHGQEPRLF